MIRPFGLSGFNTPIFMKFTVDLKLTMCGAVSGSRNEVFYII